MRDSDPGEERERVGVWLMGADSLLPRELYSGNNILHLVSGLLE